MFLAELKSMSSNIDAIRKASVQFKLTHQELLQQLKKLDPLSATITDINNKRRLIRALEVCLVTKKPFSQQRKKGQPLFDVCQIGLKLNKKTLERSINQRVEQMIKSDLIKETKKLVRQKFRMEFILVRKKIILYLF